MEQEIFWTEPTEPDNKSGAKKTDNQGDKEKTRIKKPSPKRAAVAGATAGTAENITAAETNRQKKPRAGRKEGGDLSASRATGEKATIEDRPSGQAEAKKSGRRATQRNKISAVAPNVAKAETESIVAKMGGVRSSIISTIAQAEHFFGKLPDWLTGGETQPEAAENENDVLKQIVAQQKKKSAERKTKSREAREVDSSVEAQARKQMTKAGTILEKKRISKKPAGKKRSSSEI